TANRSFSALTNSFPIRLKVTDRRSAIGICSVISCGAQPTRPRRITNQIAFRITYSGHEQRREQPRMNADLRGWTGDFVKQKVIKNPFKIYKHKIIMYIELGALRLRRLCS